MEGSAMDDDALAAFGQHMREAHARAVPFEEAWRPGRLTICGPRPLSGYSSRAVALEAPRVTELAWRRA
jgi:hypothetical protein